MRLLLDTRVFLWYISGAAQLPAVFRDAIRHPPNQTYLRAASVWAAFLRHSLEKLPLPGLPTLPPRLVPEPCQQRVDIAGKLGLAADALFQNRATYLVPVSHFERATAALRNHRDEGFAGARSTARCDR